MEKIKADIYWSDKNYCCGWSAPGLGAVFCTGKTLEEVQREFESSLRFHIEGMVEGGEEVPQWLSDGSYEIEYTLAVSALLRQAEQYTTMAALSRVTGINQKLLSNYAGSVKIPRQTQRQRIVEGLHTIGRHFLSVM